MNSIPETVLQNTVTVIDAATITVTFMLSSTNIGPITLATTNTILRDRHHNATQQG